MINKMKKQKKVLRYEGYYGMGRWGNSSACVFLSLFKLDRVGVYKKAVRYFDAIRILFDNGINYELFEKHKDELDWHRISWRMILNEDFVCKYVDRVDWLAISMGQERLNEHFFEKYQDFVSWTYAALYQNFTDVFISKHIDKIDWKCLSAAIGRRTRAKEKWLYLIDLYKKLCCEKNKNLYIFMNSDIL